MTALRLSVENLLASPNEAALAEGIAEHVRRTTGHGPSPSEIRSWGRSLPALARDLADAGLHQVEMLVEYKLPLASKRVDVVLAGVHPRSGEDSYVVVDFKQVVIVFTTADPNGLDVLICDEAHRIRETSTNRFTPAAKRTGRSRLDEQFRCGGSRTYERWVLDLLVLAGGDPSAWDGDPDFEVRLVHSPEELEKDLGGRSGTARMTAGYCWPWSDPRPDDTLVDDVVIGDWQRPWNVKKGRAVGGPPPSMLWATEPNGFGQVGCVYTAQGVSSTTGTGSFSASTSQHAMVGWSPYARRTGIRLSGAARPCRTRISTS